MIFDIEVKFTSDSVDVFSEDFWESVLKLLGEDGLIIHQNGECVVALDVVAEDVVSARLKALSLFQELGVTCTVTVEDCNSQVQISHS